MPCENTYSLVGLDDQGKIVKRRRMRPASIVGFTKILPPCIIAVEACRVDSQNFFERSFVSGFAVGSASVLCRANVD
jgi:transposase